MTTYSEQPITHGLVIDMPWIDMLLRGEKDWEMRSKRTERRGPIALIRKGTRHAVGVARLVGVHGPLSDPDLLHSTARHRMSIEGIREGRYSKWRTAWELRDAMPLPRPVPYSHPNGAVIWVALDPNCVRRLSEATKAIGSTTNGDQQ